MAADGAIPKSENKMNRKLVLWWNEECQKAVKDKNKAFRLVKRTNNMHLPEFK